MGESALEAGIDMNIDTYPCCKWCFFREFDRCLAGHGRVDFPPTMEEVDCDDYTY